MKLSERIPPNSWDSHMHVIDPDTYPLAADAQYTPMPHTLSHAMSFYSTIGGINSMVLVQPSIYGHDNTCLLDALRRVGPRRARAVVAFDPSTTASQTLHEWHALGVRGARLNLQSAGREMDAADLAATLQQYAEVIRPLHWVLQLYVPLAMAAGLEDIIPGLGVRVCLDHFGHPRLPDPAAGELYTASGDPYALPGFGSLVNLLRQGSTYVKLSAPYRISKQEGQRDLEPLARELLSVAGKRAVVFATDWPHTRFAGLDIRPFVEMVLEWCGDDQELVERLFRGNAGDLWDVEA
jgi:predicted TIM-barrel fold metal-dependent hydrolase